MKTQKSPSAIRDELQSLVLKELLGPANGADEEMSEPNISVGDRYILGKLAPNGLALIEDDNDAITILDGQVESQEDGKTDADIRSSAGLHPATIGMSFVVVPTIKSLSVTASWGLYKRVKSKLQENPKMVWRRSPIVKKCQIALIDGEIKPQILYTSDFGEVHLKGKIQQLNFNDNCFVITLFLINEQRQKKSKEKNKDETWLFQPELIVESLDAAAVFQKRQQKRQAIYQDSRYAEEQALQMLYRDKVEFAKGYGVSVHAVVSDKPQYATRLITQWLPTYDIPQTTSPSIADYPELAGLMLDMKTLAQFSDEYLFQSLRVLPAAYQNWIQIQDAKINTPALSEFSESAHKALSHCSATKKRIEAGIRLLETNPLALQAFRFANEAMYLQRVHSQYAEKRRTLKNWDNFAEIDIVENRSWRIFQLAFILINLPGITDFNHPERSDSPEALADLLWFPTGGGKTEAYLGLTAYVLALRRLQGDIEGRSGEYGVAVLMRYTLRLLTLQQFQRATALMCAAEKIRRNAKNPEKWGKNPFRIGLWVGYSTTPNSTERSQQVAKSLKSGEKVDFSSPLQLTNCPWCGSPINKNGANLEVETMKQGSGRTFIYCGDKLGLCLFSKTHAPYEGLPVLVVDEEIYRYPPALLIATVDKFAQMPWKGETQMLFGQVNGYCSRHGFMSPDIDDTKSHNKKGRFAANTRQNHNPLRPPDLIIQDELHLISGPLGSLVGLYETAIDALCSWKVNGKPVRPKVIASTATIRQADEQIRKLFMREVAIFPPHGLDIQDNFFAIQRDTTPEMPGRRYIGICALGTRLKSVLIRVYVAYLAAAQTMYQKYGESADTWMTLVGYFNSLRELGGMRRLVDDEIRERLKNSNILDFHQLEKRYLNYPYMEELTSRKNASEIPEILDKLERQFVPKMTKSEKPLDVLLATNMISVGVDVKRLGLMIVAGQPKNTAEYIQATSRVGRNSPGLVCTVYNWARPRDLSHYESFEHYHATFYQSVEALSVTPFAIGALDRGLAGILIALIRLTAEEFNKNSAAQDFDPNSEIVKQAIEIIIKRASSIEDDPEMIKEIRRLLDTKVKQWVKETKKASRQLVYNQGKTKQDSVVGLLKHAGADKMSDFTILNSLRDVEPSVGLILEVEK